MSFEMETIKLTKVEVARIVSGWSEQDDDDEFVVVGQMLTVLQRLIKLGVISEYVFAEEPKKEKKI